MGAKDIRNFSRTFITVKFKDKTCAFDGCGKKFTPVKNLQNTCKTSACIYGYVKQERERKERKVVKVEVKKTVVKQKKLSDYEAEAKAVFQEWVRLRDKDLRCISCDEFAKEYDGGHWWDAGVYSGLIFNEWNVNKQCSDKCNRMLYGNKENYRIGLVKKIGEKNVKWLEDNKDQLRNYKFTKGELIEIKNVYKAKIKELKIAQKTGKQ